MVSQFALTGHEEQAMRVLFEKLVDTTGPAHVLKRDVASRLATALFEDADEQKALVELLDQAVLEREIRGPSAFFPLFFP